MQRNMLARIRKPRSIYESVARLGRQFRLSLLDLTAQIDPSPEIWGKRRHPFPDTTAVCVYRSKNAGIVRPLVESLVSEGMSVRLWALDQPVDDLIPYTFGSGPGYRFELVNRLVAMAPAEDQILVFDDDVKFSRGTASGFLGIVHEFDLDLAMPARRPNNGVGHPIVRRSPLSILRLTSFVEIGPIIVVTRRGRDWFLPFPEEGMGWGTEVYWYQAWQRGARLGIVDAVEMQHLGSAEEADMEYDATPERARRSRLLASVGVERWHDIQVTTARIGALSALFGSRNKRATG
jgi:hypothetical protein